MRKVSHIRVALMLLMSTIGLAEQISNDEVMVKPKLENLLRTELEGADNTEVIVSRVELPANVSLPKHWHPGEEFAYVLEGEVTLWQKGKPDTTIKAGQVGKVPLKQIHTATTGDNGATLLVFRVHQIGKPERILLE